MSQPDLESVISQLEGWMMVGQVTHGAKNRLEWYDLPPLVRDMREALSLLQGMRWISPDETVPEHNKRVLCWHPDWGIEFGIYSASTEDFSTGFLVEVTPHYWMEMPILPALPEETRS